MERLIESPIPSLDQAKLNLRYCTVVAEIGGVITRRNVNPGNNLQAGQSVMAIRSLRDIWVDANFKETQLRNLRIGQHRTARDIPCAAPQRESRPVEPGAELLFRSSRINLPAKQTGGQAAAHQMALQSLENLREEQASALSYFDAFLIFTALAIGLAFMVLLMKRSAAQKKVSTSPRNDQTPDTANACASLCCSSTATGT
jgi:Barrel-sandwich domain of CusB or HlyD membrane-fusion